MPLSTSEDPSGVLFDGTQAVDTDATALNAGTSLPCRAVLVQNDPASASDVRIGNAASQSLVLEPGQAEAFTVADVALIYVKVAAGSATVNWHAEGD